ncbi:hypothetical protein KFE25_012745 [Diacronema lutheri]|uniref:Uncharacterized protein n=1 Tax=Diacronema lutheri TaxID=2081491 RepID=A0A8J5X7Y7_DIALT|nr:hypothetical protein KFE25_012745 [Diacronema lutheri]
MAALLLAAASVALGCAGSSRVLGAARPAPNVGIAVARARARAPAHIAMAAADEPDDDFDIDASIAEFDARLPSAERRKSALAEYGLSMPSVVLLALSLLLLGGTKVAGPGWLGSAIGALRSSSAGSAQP